MRITDKIKAIRRAIRANPGGATDIMIQEQSVAAILHGMSSAEWRTYMSNFKSNDAQLNRLIGQDPVFMNDPTQWGPKILAYIAGGGPCGGGTALSLPDQMDIGFKALLDNGLPTESVVGEDSPLPAEAQFIYNLELEQPTNGDE